MSKHQDDHISSQYFEYRDSIEKVKVMNKEKLTLDNPIFTYSKSPRHRKADFSPPQTHELLTRTILRMKKKIENESCVDHDILCLRDFYESRKRREVEYRNQLGLAKTECTEDSLRLGFRGADDKARELLRNESIVKSM